MQNLVLPASFALSAAYIENQEQHVTHLLMLLLSCIACYFLMSVCCKDVLKVLLVLQANTHGRE